LRKVINGIDASPGVAIGKVFLYREDELEIFKGTIADTEAEKEKLLNGRDKTKEQLLEIREKTRVNLGEDKAAIFDGHITLLEDEDLLEEVIELIEDDEISAEFALSQGIEVYCDMLSNLEDEYLRERVHDLRDISKRWLYNICEVEILDLGNLEPNTVIVANDLTPSDTAQLDLENTLAFVTSIGGKTAHSSIMARSLELPAVVGTKVILDEAQPGDEIIVDALDGIAILNLTEEEKLEHRAKREANLAEKEALKK